MTSSDAASDATPAAPAGWYPDPGGAPQWRRWDGSAWADATMPYGPPLPDPAWVVREQLTWGGLRTIAPIALLAPGVAAAELAALTADYAPVRRWAHLFLSAALHGRSVPPIPTVHTPAVAAALNFAVWVAVIIGLLAWLRFSSASVRVAVQAGYRQRHHPLWSGLALLVPFVGPVVAWATSRASLPSGHEARRVLDLGWLAVVVGEAAFVGVVASVWSTPSIAVAWAVAVPCALAWLAAAVELPAGLGAIAQDHETLRVRPPARPS